MYVRQYTAGSILRNTFQIYWRNFSTILLTYALPVFPFALLTREALSVEQPALVVIGFVLQVTVGVFAYGAITVSVSDLCLGHSPNWLRSYRRLFSKLVWRYLETSLLMSIIILIGIILLIIPGLIATVWFIFAPPVVILERITRTAALKRSRNLVKGHAWRMSGILLLLFVLIVTIAGALGFVLGLFFPVTLSVFGVFSDFLSVAFSTPIMLISVVLMYYDLRVRKEAYDTTVLAQELRR
ncbi:MAG: hypothetical protein WCC90_12005 [Methylocella sp.]